MNILTRMNASSRSPPSLNNKKSGKDDDDLDEDDSEDEIVVQHRSKSALMRRKVLVSEDDVTDSDIEFTTEDVKEEDEDDAFEDALDASFSESSNKNDLVVPFSSMTPTLRSSSSSDDDEEGEFETPIIETVVKRPTARKEKTTERGGGAGKISLFQAFRSPEAKRAFATTTPSRTATSAAKPMVGAKVASPASRPDESMASPSPSPSPSPLPSSSFSLPAPAPSSSTKNKPNNNMRLKGKTYEDEQFSLDHSVAMKLYDHQRDAVRWLWD